MRNLMLGAAIGAAFGFLALVAGVAVAVPQAQGGGLIRTVPDLTSRATRACIFPSGGATTIDASTTAASSAELNEWSRYVIQCDDDAYFATGTATAQDADSGDLWLPAGAWVEFMTTDTVTFISVKNKNNANDCHYWECR